MADLGLSRVWRWLLTISYDNDTVSFKIEEFEASPLLFLTPANEQTEAVQAHVFPTARTYDRSKSANSQ